MRPIPKFKLNQNSAYVKHQVFGPRSSGPPAARPNQNREFYVVQNKLEDQRRVLTIRTQHVLTNRTSTTYDIKLFFVRKVPVDGKQVKEIFVYQKASLKPQGSIALPDDEDQDVTDALKICLRPAGCKKWSEEFKITRLKHKLHVGQNIVWNHYKTHSILRKEATDHKEVFNYYLLPAMIVKNCLPMPLLMTFSHVVGEDQESISSRRQRIAGDDRSASAASDLGESSAERIGERAF